MKEQRTFKQVILAVFLTLTMGTVSTAKGQEVYRSSNGTIQITAVLGDTAIVAVSNELVVVMDYETARFMLKLDKSTLRTGIDSLDLKLSKMTNDFVRYQGKLGIDYIMTEKHPVQEFQIEGHLSSNGSHDVAIGNGRLEHIFSGLYSCVLNMTFHLKPEDMEFDIGIPGVENDIHVEIIQAVLDREN